MSQLARSELSKAARALSASDISKKDGANRKQSFVALENFRCYLLRLQVVGNAHASSS
jgi:hypothetical protein